MSSVKVLIIDDSMVVRHFVRSALSGEPGIADIFEASSAEEAWGMLDREAIDVVTLDLSLPDADGLQLIELLKSKAKCGVVVLSGSAETHETALKLGADACFEKEHLLEQRTAFVGRIAEICDHRRGLLKA